MASNQQSEGNITPNEETGTVNVVTQKRVRGKSRGIRLANVRRAIGNMKLPVIIPIQAGVPVCKNAAMFASELSYVVKHNAPLGKTDNFPQGVTKWKDIDDEIKDKIYKCMQSKFEFDDIPERKACVLKQANKMYREWRHLLYDKHYLEHETDADRLLHVPEGVSTADWETLVTYFGSDNFKKISEKNKKSREHEGVTQRNPETGEKPDGPELWRMTHQRPNGTWGDERSKNIHDEMVDLLSQPQPSASGESLEHLTPNEAFRRVVGQRSGHAKGYGCGPKGATTGTKRSFQEREEQLTRERDDLMRRVVHMEDTFDARVDARVQAVVQEIMKKFSGSPIVSEESTSNVNS